MPGAGGGKGKGKKEALGIRVAVGQLTAPYKAANSSCTEVLGIVRILRGSHYTVTLGGTKEFAPLAT